MEKGKNEALFAQKRSLLRLGDAKRPAICD
jgi:hypothetical protein